VESMWGKKLQEHWTCINFFLWLYTITTVYTRYAALGITSNLTIIWSIGKLTLPYTVKNWYANTTTFYTRNYSIPRWRGMIVFAYKFSWLCIFSKCIERSKSPPNIIFIPVCSWRLWGHDQETLETNLTLVTYSNFPKWFHLGVLNHSVALLQLILLLILELLRSAFAREKQSV
jgi:hypothetical protein